MSERDTKFMGFANLLWNDLHTLFMADTKDKDSLTYEEMRERYEHMDTTLIAQRAYDLVEHATKHIYKDAIYTQAPNYDKFMLAIVPDLTQWPEQT